MCYCRKFPAVTKNPIDFVVLYSITRNQTYFLVFLRYKLAKKLQKMAIFIKKSTLFIDKKRVL